MNPPKPINGGEDSFKNVDDDIPSAPGLDGDTPSTPSSDGDILSAPGSDGDILSAPSSDGSRELDSQGGDSHHTGLTAALDIHHFFVTIDGHVTKKKKTEETHMKVYKPCM